MIVGLAYTSLVLLLTLGPIPQRLPGSQADRGVLSWRSWLEPATWSTGSSIEFVANVAVFVVWGALALAVVGAPRWWIAAGVGLALTFTIEIAQIPTARISDPRDLVANGLGTLIGVGFALLVTVLRPATPRGSALDVGRLTGR